MPPEPNKNRATAAIYLTVAKDQTPVFLPLLAQGFIVRAKLGCSVKELLCSQIGLSAEYVENRVQTIFLNGKAVDDIKTTIVRQNATLALSAAMPGLAGVTLRRGGMYAAMRHQITHNKNTRAEIVADGEIVLKLFNLVAREIGPMFLMQGIQVSGYNLKNFFRGVPDHFWAACQEAEIDGNRWETDKLAHIDWKQQQVFLKLRPV